MRTKANIDRMRAEAIAKLLLLRADQRIILEKPGRDVGADFYLRLDGSMVSVAIVIVVDDGKEASNRIREATRHFSSDWENAMPVMLIQVDDNEVSGKVCLLTRLKADGTWDRVMKAKPEPYTIDFVRQLLREVENGFEARKKLAS